ncbi:elongation factor P--(R)-beta-lysine ligase [Legionella impletisoli]|uniref:Elongation factor P--(R)-beta-lysine ligase n=1 Tax=Legionella impletisoli TaxID=343510 RepID=A0A917JXQ2_9GAMM|nr:elongation factor P--(R)-beta-lysine ligase [Legionella impletisoli]GGI89434.1 elongation factor P--(R)-beta-lysine ligase [Legionella impletisoli]
MAQDLIQDIPLWKPSATLEMLQKRALVMAKIRQFFNQRGYLEVETPILGHYGVTDVYLSNIQAYFRGKPYSLQTSPEYHMKRLLAAGSGPIYQLARVFRDDELGRWHNPEFTLLEWYQLGINHHELMEEMDAFLQSILNCSSMRKMTYRDAFKNACGLDPFEANLEDFQHYLAHENLGTVLEVDETDRDQYLFLLMSHRVEPYLAQLHQPIALYDFPASQASLAKVNAEVAERFEIYFKGVELANGFHELVDAESQRLRFEEDRAKRKALGLSLPKPDPNLLAALESGLPACSGVALGVDRLLALLLEEPAISNVLAFDIARA